MCRSPSQQARAPGWHPRGPACAPAPAHPRLRRVTRALAHFLPQLALPKRFDTQHADALLGAGAPVVSEYWGRMIDHLQQTDWRGVPGLAEVAA